VTFRGLLQPVADGLKLLAKSYLFPSSKQRFLFWIRPRVLLVLFLFLWRIILPWQGLPLLSKYNSLILFSLLGVRAYSVILTGWRSTRAFSKLGSLRGILQRLSYEVALILVFIVGLFLKKTIHLNRVQSLTQEIIWFWLIIWLILVLMERNRAPFDLLEGERELIRGFNVEIGGLLFVYLFLSEYGILILFRGLTMILLFNNFLVLGTALIFFLLLIRSCFPRLRYDSLMTLIWESILPFGAILVFVCFWLK